MNYKDEQYKKRNLTSIQSLKGTSNNENNIKEMVDSLQEYLADQYEGLVGEIILGKRKKDKLEHIINDWLTQQNETTQGYMKETLIRSLVDNIVGWGKLQPLIEDPLVTNIFVNEKREVIKRVRGEDVKTNIKFDTEEELESFIRSVMIRTGEKINHNLCLQDGMDSIYRVRINAGISGSPIKKEVVRNPYLALRTYRVEDYDKVFFIGNGTFNEGIAEFFETKTMDANVIVVGEPDAGKTTLLEYIQNIKKKKDPMRRVIRIEEQPELAFDAENSVSFFERKTSDSNDDTRKTYDMAEFAKQATRLAGKDVIIGEVRGSEAWYLMRLLNMGYKGLCSVHGDSAKAAIYQLAFLMNLEATNARMDMLIQRICEIVDFIVYVSQKKVITIAEVVGYNFESGQPILREIFDLDFDENDKLYWKEQPLTHEFEKKRKMAEALRKRRV